MPGFGLEINREMEVKYLLFLIAIVAFIPLGIAEEGAEPTFQVAHIHYSNNVSDKISLSVAYFKAKRSFLIKSHQLPAQMVDRAEADSIIIEIEKQSNRPFVTLIFESGEIFLPSSEAQQLKYVLTEKGIADYSSRVARLKDRLEKINGRKLDNKTNHKKN